MSQSAEITEYEQRVVAVLGQAWNMFLELPDLHPSDRQEFMQAIHQAQNIVLARVGLRSSDLSYKDPMEG
jgi:hypothetical protein